MKRLIFNAAVMLVCVFGVVQVVMANMSPNHLHQFPQSHPLPPNVINDIVNAEQHQAPDHVPQPKLIQPHLQAEHSAIIDANVPVLGVSPSQSVGNQFIVRAQDRQHLPLHTFAKPNRFSHP